MKRKKYIPSHPLRRLCSNGKQRERVYIFSWHRVKMEKLAKIQEVCPMWVTIFFLLLSFFFFLSTYLMAAFNNTTVDTQPFLSIPYLENDSSSQIFKDFIQYCQTRCSQQKFVDIFKKKVTRQKFLKMQLSYQCYNL